MKSKQFATLVLTTCVVWLMAHEAQAFYNPSTGRWLSRDPIAERNFGDQRQSPKRGLGFNRDALATRSGFYAFVHNDPVSEVDSLGLFAASEGYAFRDPWYGSRGEQSGSGYQLSSSAHYEGWGSPLSTSICNSGVLRVNPDGSDYPPHRTSFLRGTLVEYGRKKKYRISCYVGLAAFVWGRQNPGGTYKARGHILGERITDEDTWNAEDPLFPGAGRAFLHKAVTKEVTIEPSGDSAFTFELYHVYMPVALQVENFFRGGFSEVGESRCEISRIPVL